MHQHINSPDCPAATHSYCRVLVVKTNYHLRALDTFEQRKKQIGGGVASSHLQHTGGEASVGQ
eukprot:10744-Heterococcus_DN1.PRE.6